MHPTAEEFVAETEQQYGFTPAVESFDEGTKTAADAADAIGCDVAQIASSIVMVSEGEVVVVVTSGANHVEEERIADELEAASVRMANPDEATQATGWSIGGVPPICHETDVPVLFDETLLDHETVWAAAGTPETVWPIDPDRLRELADARVVQVAD